MRNNIGIIIQREFAERVAKKSFIITTLVMPVLMVLLMAAPAIIMNLSTPSSKHLAVVDQSGEIFEAVSNGVSDIPYITVERYQQPVDSALASGKYDGVLYIGPDIVENPRNATLYLHDAGSIEIESKISDIISDRIEDIRLKAYDIDNLQQILAEIKADVRLTTLRIDQESGAEEATSSLASTLIGFSMTFILYMFLLMYGQMVMTSIIEEKTNRVLELVVSSVKPVQLMMGKILGVGLVAVVQVIIWGILICMMSAFLVPLLLPADVVQGMAAANAGTLDVSAATLDPEMLQVLAQFTSVGYLATLFGYILLFLIGGFLFYASIFAAIGSAVDNVQDASQLTSFAVIPIIIALVFAMSVAQDPNTTTAVWLSIIPFTSPMVMLARIPFGIPAWEIWLSVVVLYLSFVVMAWFAGKIYRVGIFMYGKKPSVRDLIRWARYK